MTVFVDHHDSVYSEKLNRRGKLQRQYDYFAKESAHQFGPEAFLVDFGPDRVTGAHFHSVDQFQIFFGAPGGLYQRHQIPGVELHYADAFHTYGPFSAADERIKFFTLRPCQGQFRGEMPAERDKLRYQGRRGIHVDLDPLMAVVATPGEVSAHDVIPREADGLAATLFIAGADAEIRPPSAAGTSGVYLCVLAGEVDAGDGPVGPLALGWTLQGEDSRPLRCGPDGARVLAMSYPDPPTPAAHDTADDATVVG